MTQTLRQWIIAQSGGWAPEQRALLALQLASDALDKVEALERRAQVAAERAKLLGAAALVSFILAANLAPQQLADFLLKFGSKLLALL